MVEYGKVKAQRVQQLRQLLLARQGWTAPQSEDKQEPCFAEVAVNVATIWQQIGIQMGIAQAANSSMDMSVPAKSTATAQEACPYVLKLAGIALAQPISSCLCDGYGLSGTGLVK